MNSNTIYIEDLATKRIRFTRAGHERYARRLARVGYNIESIRNKAQLAEALDAMFMYEMRELARSCKGRDAEMDRLLSGLPGWDD